MNAGHEPAAAWRAYTDLARPMDELLVRRRSLTDRLTTAHRELAEREAAAADEQRELDEQARRAKEVWAGFTERVGVAAGVAPRPNAAGTDLEVHLTRAERAAGGPIRFPMLAASLRMAGFGLLGAVTYCLIVYGLMMLVAYQLTGTVLHVVALLLFFLGLAGAPAVGFLTARNRLDAAAGGEDDRPALFGFLMGALVAIGWLAIVLVRTIDLVDG